MKCLIIAAGKGERLQQSGDSKPLVPILGVPLIERVIRAAMEAGGDEFYVVIGYQGEQVRLFLERLAERLVIRITPLVNDDWDKENGVSILKGRDVRVYIIFLGAVANIVLPVLVLIAVVMNLETLRRVSIARNAQH